MTVIIRFLERFFPENMLFITVSGTDGSGKSTQLALLREHFETSGREVAYFHAVGFSIANRLNRKIRGGKDFVPGREKAATSASPVSILLRKLFLLIDLIRFRFFLRSLERGGIDVLLSDRYFYDSVVNIEFLSGPDRPFRFPDRIIPRPDFAFFLDVSPETVMGRERAPEQGAEYVSRKRALFQADAERFGFHVIDAGGSKEEVFPLIRQIIEP